MTVGSLFIAADGRSPWARRYRDMVGMLANEAGGLENLTELRLSLIRRCAALILECEKMEVQLANGEEIDVDLLARLSSHVRRISETIGLDRAVRDVTPTLADIVAGYAAKAAASAATASKPPEGPPVATNGASRAHPAPQPRSDALAGEETSE